MVYESFETHGDCVYDQDSMQNGQNAYTSKTYSICLLYNWSMVWIGRIVFYAFYKSHTDGTVST